MIPIFLEMPPLCKKVCRKYKLIIIQFSGLVMCIISVSEDFQYLDIFRYNLKVSHCGYVCNF